MHFKINWLNCISTPIHHWLRFNGGARFREAQPLFETILVFENFPVDLSSPQKDTGLEIRNMRSFVRENYPISVVILPNPTLSIQIKYGCSRFDTSMVSRILAHFEMLFNHIAHQPDLPVKSFNEMLAETDRQQRRRRRKERQTNSLPELKGIKRRVVSSVLEDN